MSGWTINVKNSTSVDCKILIFQSKVECITDADEMVAWQCALLGTGQRTSYFLPCDVGAQIIDKMEHNGHWRSTELAGYAKFGGRYTYRQQSIEGTGCPEPITLVGDATDPDSIECEYIESDTGKDQICTLELTKNGSVVVRDSNFRPGSVGRLKIFPTIYVTYINLETIVVGDDFKYSACASKATGFQLNMGTPVINILASEVNNAIKFGQVDRISKF